MVRKVKDKDTIRWYFFALSHKKKIPGGCQTAKERTE